MHVLARTAACDLEMDPFKKAERAHARAEATGVAASVARARARYSQVAHVCQSAPRCTLNSVSVKNVVSCCKAPVQVLLLRSKGVGA